MTPELVHIRKSLVTYLVDELIAAWAENESLKRRLNNYRTMSQYKKADPDQDSLKDLFIKAYKKD